MSPSNPQETPPVCGSNGSISPALKSSHQWSEVVHSPSDSGSDTDTDTSQRTLDDNAGVYSQLGHPLRRVVRVGTTNGEGLFEGNLPPGTLSRDSARSVASSSSDWSSTSSVVYDIDYEKLVEDLLEEHPTFNAEAPDMMFIEPSTPEQRDSLMIECMSRTSPQLFIILELNQKELRSDPWNPVPHLRCAVERGNNIYLCMERLNPYDQPPLKTVANYLDFFRQVLEGLAFLHEHHIGNVSFRDPATCIMVDLGSAPSTCTSLDDFDRTVYPVRYYFTNLRNARRYNATSETSTSAFGHDVQECGAMIGDMLIRIPCVEQKMKSLITEMATGAITADAALKLFEALCKSFAAPTFDTSAGCPQGSSNRPSLSLPTRSTPKCFLRPLSR